MVPKKDDDVTPSWQWDRKVPVAIIGVALTQIVGAVWMFSNLAADSRDHDRRLQVLENRSVERTVEFSNINDRLARIEQRLLDLVESINIKHGELPPIHVPG